MNKNLGWIAGGILFALSFGLYVDSPNKVSFNPSKKKFIQPLKIPVFPYSGMALAAGDMNKDGLVDLLSTDINGKVYVHLNRGNNDFGERQYCGVTISQFAYGGKALAAADMDGDGLVDLLSADVNGRVCVYKNLGDMIFEDN